MTRIVKSDITFIDTKCVKKKGSDTQMNTKAIAERLIELRGNKSQDEVAKAIGISKSALSMYENGSRVPRDEIKVRLANYYKKSVQHIFFNKNDTKRA